MRESCRTKKEARKGFLLFFKKPTVQGISTIGLMVENKKRDEVTSPDEKYPVSFWEPEK